MAKEKKREFSPIKGQMADPEQIFCRNCAFRDKTVINIDGDEIPIGITRDTCDIYVSPNLKPTEILLQDAPCDYWVQDRSVAD